eukprot:CFRG6680T1
MSNSLDRKPSSAKSLSFLKKASQKSLKSVHKKRESTVDIVSNKELDVEEENSSKMIMDDTNEFVIVSNEFDPSPSFDKGEVENLQLECDVLLPEEVELKRLPNEEKHLLSRNNSRKGRKSPYPPMPIKEEAKHTDSMIDPNSCMWLGAGCLAKQPASTFEKMGLRSPDATFLEEDDVEYVEKVMRLGIVRVTLSETCAKAQTVMRSVVHLSVSIGWTNLILCNLQTRITTSIPFDEIRGICYGKVPIPMTDIMISAPADGLAIPDNEGVESLLIYYGSGYLQLCRIKLTFKCSSDCKRVSNILARLIRYRRIQRVGVWEKWVLTQYESLYKGETTRTNYRSVWNMFGRQLKSKVDDYLCRKLGFTMNELNANPDIHMKRFTLFSLFDLYTTLRLRADIVTAVEHNSAKHFFRPKVGAKRQDEEYVWMETYELVDFLKRVQCIPTATPAIAKEIIETHEPHLRNRQLGRLGAKGMVSYLQSSENDIVESDHMVVFQDMTQPLPHYWHNTSHNTYLTSHQFKGLSSVDMYSKVLLSGCRCVELDCWDGDNGEPIIYHGYTLVTKILFEDVIKTIREYSFLCSPYPVVLSIENHCSVAQQKRMAAIMRNILGSYLLDDYFHGYKSFKALPSPAHLMYKILVKAKKPISFTQNDNVTTKHNTSSPKRASGSSAHGSLTTSTGVKSKQGFVHKKTIRKISTEPLPESKMLDTSSKSSMSDHPSETSGANTKSNARQHRKQASQTMTIQKSDENVQPVVMPTVATSPTVLGMLNEGLNESLFGTNDSSLLTSDTGDEIDDADESANKKEDGTNMHGDVNQNGSENAYRTSRANSTLTCKTTRVLGMPLSLADENTKPKAVSKSKSTPMRSKSQKSSVNQTRFVSPISSINSMPLLLPARSKPKSRAKTKESPTTKPTTTSTNDNYVSLRTSSPLSGKSEADAIRKSSSALSSTSIDRLGRKSTGNRYTLKSAWSLSRLGRCQSQTSIHIMPRSSLPSTLTSIVHTCPNGNHSADAEDIDYCIERANVDINKYADEEILTQTQVYNPEGLQPLRTSVTSTGAEGENMIVSVHSRSSSWCASGHPKVLGPSASVFKTVLPVSIAPHHPPLAVTNNEVETDSEVGFKPEVSPPSSRIFMNTPSHSSPDKLIHRSHTCPSKNIPTSATVQDAEILDGDKHEGPNPPKTRPSHNSLICSPNSEEIHIDSINAPWTSERSSTSTSSLALSTCERYNWDETGDTTYMPNSLHMPTSLSTDTETFFALLSRSLPCLRDQTKQQCTGPATYPCDAKVPKHVRTERAHSFTHGTTSPSPCSYMKLHIHTDTSTIPVLKQLSHPLPNASTWPHPLSHTFSMTGRSRSEPELVSVTDIVQRKEGAPKERLSSVMNLCSRQWLNDLKKNYSATEIQEGVICHRRSLNEICKTTPKWDECEFRATRPRGNTTVAGYSGNDVLPNSLKHTATSFTDEMKSLYAQEDLLSTFKIARGSENDTLSSRDQDEKKESEVASELSALVNYIEAVRFDSFGTSTLLNKRCHMSSFSEANAKKKCEKEAQEYAKYSTRQLSRIYPSAKRMDSSNYNPQTMWACGAQMVALNFQTYDVFMQLNEAKFAFNGMSGYVLKPLIMNRIDSGFDPHARQFDQVEPMKLSIEILGGHHISNQKMCSLAVVVELYGLKHEYRRYKTKTLSQNSLNPRWEDEIFSCKVSLPDIALVKFSVLNVSSGKYIGQCTIPLRSVRLGYRHVPIRDMLGSTTAYGALFVKVNTKEEIPLEHADFLNTLMAPSKTPKKSENPINDVCFGEALSNPVQAQETRARIREEEHSTLAMMLENPTVNSHHSTSGVYGTSVQEHDCKKTL